MGKLADFRAIQKAMFSWGYGLYFSYSENDPRIWPSLLTTLRTKLVGTYNALPPSPCDISWFDGNKITITDIIDRFPINYDYSGATQYTDKNINESQYSTIISTCWDILETPIIITGTGRVEVTGDGPYTITPYVTNHNQVKGTCYVYFRSSTPYTFYQRAAIIFDHPSGEVQGTPFLEDYYQYQGWTKYVYYIEPSILRPV